MVPPGLPFEPDHFSTTFERLRRTRSQVFIAEMSSDALAEAIAVLELG